MVRGLSLASRRQDKEMQKKAKCILGPPPCHSIRHSQKLRSLLCGAAAAVLASCGSGLAWAQNAPAPAIAQAPIDQGPPQRQEPDNRTGHQRAAENYDAPGVRVGSFLLFPDLELDETFNDNIYAASN